jgi:dihydroorotate dehydrogenase (fumarate)
MASEFPPMLDISPPLLNSANPWATTLDDLRGLYLCASTGAVTTRTSLIKGFNHDDSRHQYLFFNPSTNVSNLGSKPAVAADEASLNNLGYSPITLDCYLDYAKTIVEENPGVKKPFIVSVTGTPEEVAECCELVTALSKSVSVPLAMEINLSCPNIPNAPPPAYDGLSLQHYLDLLPSTPSIPIGIKTPPYTHANDFKTLISALQASASTSIAAKFCKLSFITATNTLGSCLVLNAADGQPQLPGSGIGGMAGPPLHPLALGNVATIRRMLDEHEKLKHIRVIGVGGVGDKDGFARMMKVGAYAVGVGTALGKEGAKVFDKILSL